MVYENKPTIVIIAAAKVGGIYANNNEPACFIFREPKKIQTNLIELSWKYNVKTLLFSWKQLYLSKVI